MTPTYVSSEGILVEPVGHLWAAFSPASGETALINDESAAVLEVLDSNAGGTLAVSAALTADSGLDVASLARVVDASWPRLVEAGLVRELRLGHASPR